MTPASSPVVLLLAAGEGRRFGGAKQLAEIEGEPMCHRVARLVLGLGFPVVAVTGAHAEAVEHVLRELPLHRLRHEGWSEGMGSSIAAGTRHVMANHSRASGILICLSDQPLLNVEGLRDMVARHRVAPDKVLMARHNGIPGPPTLLPRDCFAELAMLTGPAGARSVIERDMSRVEFFDFPENLDVDTPQDLDDVRQHLLNTPNR
ncbi:nucleotidyltransferase family protein [Dyella psychrodurans]|uniref:Nucleotidyltransferase family protein n=1 Tax=Dyella psychrodurans TaxID=1927960 RepID=A0A370XCP7_9GAMM|nr:nucleotidyltransferase family protein [Dyella psychrodurans]RDS86176.1 nucleotidyltransferase family protein [Dyella psychrodurans]